MPGDLIDERNTSQDLRLVQMAMRKKWKIPDTIFEHLPTRIAQIAADEGRNERIEDRERDHLAPRG
jgi:hypothetical protein